MKLFRKMRSWVLRRTIERVNRATPEPPHHALREKHTTHARLLPDREALLRALPAGGVVAEIGVDEGTFSESILRICQPRTLHLVDAWQGKRFGPKLQLVEAKFKASIADGRLRIDRGLSLDVAPRFEDRYFDWVYIDTTHMYELTLQELVAYSAKVKPGGILAGHDYTTGNWKRFLRYGVIEAVHQFCVEHDWELLYLTANVKEVPSFAIKKISG